jgi:hypothetical protein
VTELHTGGRCFRCGIDVSAPGLACRDCVDTDPKLVRAWRPAPPVVVRADVERPPDCPVPSRTARDRHGLRGEPACRACLDYVKTTRPSRAKKVTA